MLSPYEGERIFEAEMVRLHQCDRTLYTCATQPTAQPATRQRSLWQWLTRREEARRTPPNQQVRATSSACTSDY
ncbi:MAG TPA: hypothetical protein GX400_20435 [Chloroflexi bacterium]|nr:hypothetical protein [Chloroflexota bacterium]